MAAIIAPLLVVSQDFGISAAVIARSLYEYVVVTRYLIKYRNEPRVLRDFRDYGLMAFFESAKLDADSQAPKKFKLAYERVKPKFQHFEKWHRKDIRTLAKDVGLGDLYDTFYKLTSSIAHGDALTAIMEAGVAWNRVDSTIDTHYCDITLDAVYMLMAMLYESVAKCLGLGCEADLAILQAVSMKRVRAFAGETDTGGSKTVH